MTLIAKGEVLSAKLEALNKESREWVDECRHSRLAYLRAYHSVIIAVKGTAGVKKAEAVLDSLEEDEAYQYATNMLDIVKLDIRSTMQEISLLQTFARLQYEQEQAGIRDRKST